METFTLNFMVEDLEEDIFDFDYSFTTVGDITQDVLEEDFIEYYRYFNSGMETVEKFKFYLKRMWLKEIKPFNKRLLAEYELETIGLYDNKIETSSSNTLNGEVQYSDTPNQTISSDYSYLTDITKNDNSSEENGSRTSSKNEALKLVELDKKMKDMEYAFFDKFVVLFSTGIVIKDIILK